MIGRLFVASVVLATAGAANADLTVESARLAGSASINAATGEVAAAFRGFSGRSQSDRGPGPAVLYSNLTAPSGVTASFSQAGTAAIYGDRVTYAGTGGGGALDQFAFTILNSSTSNTVPMTTGTMNIEFRRGLDNSLIGGFSVNLAPFFAGLTGGNLPPGFFAIVDVAAIALVANITFDTTDVLMRQQLVGGQGRYGIAIYNPIAVGTGSQPMYISNPPGVPEGFYNLGNPAIQANPGYYVFIPTPGAACLLGLAGLVAIRRRR